MSDLNEWIKERRRIREHALTLDERADTENAYPALLTAVEKVLELHRKEHFTATMKPYCVHCRAREVEWPCPTVQAVRSAIEASE